MKNPILCIGDANADLIIKTSLSDSVQTKNMDIVRLGKIDEDPDQVKFVPGGVIGTTSATICALGGKVEFLGHGGDDVFGKKIKTYLSDIGVGTTHYTLLNNVSSLIVICLISPSGERDFRTYPFNGSAPSLISDEDFPTGIEDEISAVFTSGVQLTEEPVSSSVLKFMERCRSKNIPVAFDVNLRTNTFGWSDKMKHRFEKALSLSSIIFGSATEELPQVTSSDTVDEAVSKLLSCEGKLIISKDGANGSTAYSRSQRIFVPAFPVDVVDTVGAGDTFNGGFLAAWYMDLPIKKCMEWGTAAAAYSLGFEGSSKRPHREDIEGIFKKYISRQKQTSPQ